MKITVNDFKSRAGLWVRSMSHKNTCYQTFSCNRYDNIKLRCLTGGSVQQKHPSYVGCYMSDNFEDFQYFADWHTSQVGYNCDNYDLDKDLLIEGNKEYSEKYCVLIPKSLNVFLTDKKMVTGKSPIGYYWNTDHLKYRAKVSCPERGEVGLGYFDRKEDAFEAYKFAKESIARRWCERLENREFVVDERVIERMRNWTVPKDKNEDN